MTLPVEGFLNLHQQTPPNTSDDPLSVQVETTPGVGSQASRGLKPVVQSGRRPEQRWR